MQVTTTPERFKKAFKPYLVSWGTAYAILISLITTIAICVVIPRWRFSQQLISLFMDIGAIYDGRAISYGVFAIGANLSGIIATGMNVIGVFTFGMNNCGFVAIGMNVVGVIAVGGNAVGIIAIGHGAFGLYSLSYSERGRGKYLFAPHRQDPEAVTFFTRWLPKLKAAMEPVTESEK